MNYLRWMIVIFLLGFLMIGSQLYESNQETKWMDEDYGDIYNFTESKIVVPDINISENYPVEKTKGLINIGRFYKIVDAFVDFSLISAEQGMKMGVEYGYQNPEINWDLLFKYTTYALFIFITVLLLKPIGYLIVFIILLSITIKEKINKRKKKNDIRRKSIQ